MLDIWENVSVQRSGKAGTGYSKEEPLEWEGEAIPRFPEGQDTFSTMNLARSASCCATCFISTASVNSLPKVRWVWGAQTKAGHSRSQIPAALAHWDGDGNQDPRKKLGQAGIPHPSPSRSARPAATSWMGRGKLQKQSVQAASGQKQSHRPAPASCSSLCSQRKTPGKEGQVYKPHFNI